MKKRQTIYFSNVFTNRTLKNIDILFTIGCNVNWYFKCHYVNGTWSLAILTHELLFLVAIADTLWTVNIWDFNVSNATYFLQIEQLQKHCAVTNFKVR